MILFRPARGRLLYSTSVSVGNGADLTDDILQTYTVPGGTLAAVGDRLRLTAFGTAGATTDSKTPRVKWGVATLHSLLLATAGQVSWRVEMELVKTGANAQIRSALFFGSNNVVTGVTLTSALNDTIAGVITVTGQNATNSVAGSITCGYFRVEYLPI